LTPRAREGMELESERMPTKAKSKPKSKAAKRPPRVVQKKPAATKRKAPAAKGARSSATKRKGSKAAPQPRLLSGGNPQIAKGYGDAPVQAYIAALPSWKRELGRRVDKLITRTIPSVNKAVKWNSPMYGVEGQGWFLGVHAYTKYLKLAFFRGRFLRPLPPGESKDKYTRYLDLHEGEEFDEKQLAEWVRQAASRPGWVT
jgi:hypothetical protein